MELTERVSELERKFEEVFIRGVIVESNPVEKWVVVSYGTVESPMNTGKLPIKPIRAGKAIVWWFPEIGEGVTVISPGDLRFGEVFPGSYYSERPAPSDDPELFLIEFGDGSKVSHHRGTHLMELLNMGDVEATVKGKTSLNCEESVSVFAKGSINVETEQMLTVKSSLGMRLVTYSDMEIKAGGNMKLIASRIDLNE